MTDPLKRDWVAVSDLAKAKGVTRAAILQMIARRKAKGIKIRTEKMGNQVVINRKDIASLS